MAAVAKHTFDMMTKRLDSLKKDGLGYLSEKELETIIELSGIKFDEEEEDIAKELIRRVPYVHHFKRECFGEPAHAYRHDPVATYLDQVLYRILCFGKKPEESTFTSSSEFSGKRKSQSKKHKSHSKKRKNQSKKRKSQSKTHKGRK